MTTVYISIFVLKGDLLDYPQYRHTALWLEFGNDSPSLLVHVVGPHGEFKFESRESSQPYEVEGYAKKIDVGFLNVKMTSAQIVSAL